MQHMCETEKQTYIGNLVYVGTSVISIVSNIHLIGYLSCTSGTQGVCMGDKMIKLLDLWVVNVLLTKRRIITVVGTCLYIGKTGNSIVVCMFGLAAINRACQ